MNQAETSGTPKIGMKLPPFARAAGQWIADHPAWMIVLLGLALRLIGGESRSLQYDDTFSIFLARRSFSEILTGTAADTMPPLYYFLLHFWLLLGEGLFGSPPVWYIRLLTVLINLGALLLFYNLVKRLFGQAAAGWAGLLAALSPLQLYHAQDVRMYALLLAGQVGYLFFFARLYFLAPGETPRRWNWVGLVGCGLAAMYTHNVAVFGLVVPDIYLFLRRDWKGLLRLLAAQMIVGLLALPWLLLIPGQIAKVQRAWSLPQPGLIEALQAIIMFTASLPLPFELLIVAAVLSLQIFVLLALETGRYFKNALPAGRNGMLFLVCLLLAPPVLLFAASYVMKPVFIPRAFLVSSLAYCGVAGVVIAHKGLRSAGLLIAGAFLLAAGLSLPSFYTYQDFPRSPYRAATEYLRAEAGPAIRIIHENKLSAFSSCFYAPDLDQVFVKDIPDSPNDTFEPASQEAMQLFPEPDLESAVGDRSEVYYVLFSNTFEEYRALGLTQHPGLQWLDEHFTQVDRQVFNDLEVYHYRR